MTRVNDYDVIVVGGGGGGLAAALEARRAGASVVILEADKHLGGATANSGGVFYACDQGEDIHFRKQAPKLFRTGPFYAVEIRSAIIGNTAAGLDIDTGTRVLDQHQRPIPGLYAAGEVLGCFQGARYGGGGLAVGNAIVFGREAGIRAAAHALQGAQL